MYSVFVEYFFDHEWEHERERLRGLERFYDPLTHENIERVGIQPGWYCLEAGGGGGSIAEWLAWRVGPTGRVLVTDLETRFLDRLAGPTIEVQQHRLGHDPLPSNVFDLVHARAVMEHQPDRMPALRQIYETLRPGGWVVLESGDFSTVAAGRPEDVEMFERVWNALVQIRSARGFRLDCGRYLSYELEQVGFAQVTFEGRSYQWGGNDDPLTNFYIATIERLRMGLTDYAAAGVTKGDVDEFVAMCKSPNFRASTHVTCSVAGRKPWT